MENYNENGWNAGQNRDDRYVTGYDTQTGEPIYNDGSRGTRENADNGSEAPRDASSGFGTPVDYGSRMMNEESVQPPQPEPMPMPEPESNVYRFQNTEAVKPKKKKKTGWTMPKIAGAAVLFGVIASGCFFGVNAGLNALTGGGKPDMPPQGTGQQRIEANTDNSGIGHTSTVASGATDVSGVVEEVMPSVIAVKETTTVQNMFGQTQEAEAAGSGFIVKQDGDELLAVTNSHVVNNAKKISVVFCDGEEAEATVKGVSTTNDLALLTIDVSKMKDSTKKAIKAATLRSADDVKVGEMAIAIGNANGSGQSVTVGYVSATDRTFVVGSTDSNGQYNTRPMIQTDAAINPGNSGGPLIDSRGRVIGITTSKEFSASDGRDIVGMNYAIPMSDVVSVINDLMNREVLKDEEKGYLGITGEPIDAAASKQFNMPEGVYVKAISDTGAAAKAGICQGDIITAIDGTKVSTISDVQEIVNSKRVGTTIELTIQRNNGKEYDEQKVKVTLASKDTLDGLQDEEKDTDKETPDQQDSGEQGNPYGDDDQIIPWGFGY